MSITYTSTRGKGCLGFEEVVLGGLAKDKGLYVPSSIPKVTKALFEQMKSMSFPDLAYELISLYVQPDQIPAEELRRLVTESFRSFRNPDVTPCVKLADFWVLELFHGPTFAFKDVALQFLGNLFEYFLQRGKYQTKMTILGATSGDTGSAAIYGLKGKENINCFILFPEGKVSEVQERQMTTVSDENIHCIGIEGDFDDAQSLVKTLFSDQSIQQDLQLGAINSINWARILAQITYYFYAWCQICGEQSEEKPLTFCVPTGNFGDILAGYYAKQMGLPIEKLVVCTNENDVLNRFFTTGCYQRAPARATIAPSMDISVSSNLERYLYYLCNESPEILNQWMTRFETTGSLEVNELQRQICSQDFLSVTATTTDIVETMRDTFLRHNYLVCPHTATAVVACKSLNLLSHQTVVLATAHPAKFEDAINKALPKEAVPTKPIDLTNLFNLPTRKVVLPHDEEELKRYLRRCSGK